MTDQEFLRSINVEPYETPTGPSPGPSPMIESPEQVCWLQAFIDEDGVLHMMYEDFQRIVGANHSLRTAAENWCKRAQAAEKRARCLLAIAATLAAILASIVVNRG